MAGRINALSALEHLSPSDTFRSGAVVSLNRLIDRGVFAVKELFNGGWGARDRRAFKEFYGEVKGRIAFLNQSFELNQNLDEALPALQTLLKVQAKIVNSSWAKSLKKNSEDYKNFTSDLAGLSDKANGMNLADWALRADGDNRGRIVRWIQADSHQRRFAAYSNNQHVPFRGDEIPAGSVIITDPKAYLLSLKIIGKRSLLKALIVKIKSILCLIFNGMPYTHAEIALGKGEFFDLDKPNHGWCRGQGTIQTRIEKKTGRHRALFYGTIVQPNREAMVQAYNNRFPNQAVPGFNELFAKIDGEARLQAPQVKATFWDVFKTGIKIWRTPTYDCTTAWQPGKKKYGCSATVSSLFSKFGIDIGAQFNKVDQNIKPGDFLSSKFFQPFYTAGH